ncbi:hypothetical protein LHYA1_G009149 [Lachnellula hyalina]|uniref:Endonuclease/exonuclease/phosphatase domain-containing protein n=1 Tax=Lachnellula hyalina TaxID=1316788 RepID=A0A8H8QSS5_9HELO|nr:uncharacterized protein LHYA1_G009149 [Lachnellula hyalina]TVY22079.1 hypothetical protein LHYA1_G009149 [Lachnellula hyalina]
MHALYAMLRTLALKSSKPSLDITPRIIAYIARSYRPRVVLASDSLNDSDFQALDQLLPPLDSVFCGDFNAYNPWWDPLYEACDEEGNTLADWIDYHDLALLNTPGISTFHRPHIARPINIDLTLAHRSIANHIQDWAIVDDIGSNHFSITFTIKGSRIGLADPQTTRFDTKRADWAKFGEKLFCQLSPL